MEADERRLAEAGRELLAGCVAACEYLSRAAGGRPVEEALGTEAAELYEVLLRAIDKAGGYDLLVSALASASAEEQTLRTVWPRLSVDTRVWFIVSGWLDYDDLPLFALGEKLAARAEEEGDPRYRAIMEELEAAR
jgi:hypothetical protein